jgi:hypothetical protein
LAVISDDWPQTLVVEVGLDLSPMELRTAPPSGALIRSAD